MEHKLLHLLKGLLALLNLLPEPLPKDERDSAILHSLREFYGLGFRLSLLSSLLLAVASKALHIAWGLGLLETRREVFMGPQLTALGSVVAGILCIVCLSMSIKLFLEDNSAEILRKLKPHFEENE